jgi:hypothetical protein
LSNLLRNAVVQLTLTAAFLCTAGAVELADLKWLTGCWSSDTDGRQAREQWMASAGGTMLGMSHTVLNGKTSAFEFMRIVQEESGEIYFIATPSGQSETRFKLVRSGERDMMFENPEHDFPHRVIYRLEPDGSLVGRIEGMTKGRAKAIDFPLKRVVCDGSL